MTRNLLEINSLSFTLSHKVCFDIFSSLVADRSRIAIIGNNGAGKSSLLKIIAGDLVPSDGLVKIANNTTLAYVPQIIATENNLSGGQRFNKILSEALSAKPDLLLLDEPTNHLDLNNRRSLMRMLNKYSGALIVASHDKELLRNCVETIWHIDNGQIHIFNGNFDDYISEQQIAHNSITKELASLERQKQDMHDKLMQEQQRASKSKASGEKKMQNKTRTKMAADFAQSRAQKSQGKKLKNIDHKKQESIERLNSLRLPEIIIPKFSINAVDIINRTIISISNGSIGYQNNASIVQDINLAISAHDRLAILGDNGSGKSTLIKAILQDEIIVKNGDWHLPKTNNIGYLDQHYLTLKNDLSVFETIAKTKPDWIQADVRKHLNDFLFRKNEEVNAKVFQLSGGEKARLSLAKIAAHTPNLLILDEITNNLDITTKEHVAQVLKNYPAALLVISHDSDFLDAIGIQDFYVIKNGEISCRYNRHI